MPTALNHAFIFQENAVANQKRLFCVQVIDYLITDVEVRLKLYWLVRGAI